MDEILWFDQSNEPSPALLSNGTIYWYTVLTLNSADEILWCDHSNEIYLAVPSKSTIRFSIFCGRKIEVL